MALDPLIYSKMKDFCIDTIETLITDRPDVFYPVGTVQVFRQMQRDETNVSYPCIIVTETGLFPELMAGDTEKYFWMLPFNILIQDRESGSLQEAEPRYMGWHQCLMDKFRQALFYDEFTRPFVQADVFPKPIFESNDKRYLEVIGGMALKFWAIESRS